MLNQAPVEYNLEKNDDSDRDSLLKELRKEPSRAKGLGDRIDILRSLAKLINGYAVRFTDASLEFALLIKKARAQFDTGRKGDRI